MAAKVVLVFLGARGWGPTHERLVDEALRLSKVVIPVVVGEPPDDAFARGQGVFERLRYVEVKSLDDDAGIRKLAEQVRAALAHVDHQFDALVSEPR